VGFVKVLSDINDPVILPGQAKFISESFGGELVEVKAEQGHFDAKQEPTILQNIVPAIKVFTTRPDTLYGATYMVLAPEHPLVSSITSPEKKIEVEKYVAETKKKNEMTRTDLAKEKTGVFTGSYAINPATQEKIPVWIADYVLMTYGTGAIMAVPAHDERDFAFAEKFKLPIKHVIAPLFTTVAGPDAVDRHLDFLDERPVPRLLDLFAEQPQRLDREALLPGADVHAEAVVDPGDEGRGLRALDPLAGLFPREPRV